MAERGDVLQSKRRLGFGPDRDGERFVVIQATALGPTLPTVVVVPLDPHVDVFSASPLALRISAREVGARADHVAVAWQIHTLPADRFLAGRVGKLETSTLSELEKKLLLVLDL